MPKINIPLRVKNLVAKYNTSCPWQLASDLGIEIVFHKMSLSVRGFHCVCGKKKAIVVNAALNEFEQTITVAHELAHIKLHSGQGLQFSASYFFNMRKSSIEREADIFVLCLLCNLDDVDRREIEHYITEADDHQFRAFIRRYLDWD